VRARDLVFSHIEHVKGDWSGHTVGEPHPSEANG
jgi:hypothetical protein